MEFAQCVIKWTISLVFLLYCSRACVVGLLAALMSAGAMFVSQSCVCRITTIRVSNKHGRSVERCEQRIVAGQSDRRDHSRIR